tara:strand:- start:425 stop:634 length:210 start_codon:yes stop_codon:yes gene_type:complete
MEIVNILLSIIGFFLAIAVKQLISISKSLSEIKTALEVLTTKHDYLEERVKNLENINYNKNKTYSSRNL